MLGPVPFTIAGEREIRDRLNRDGLAALGLAGPLLSPVWTETAPIADLTGLSFTVAQPWFAPIAGMLINEPDARALGLSGLDGAPLPPGGAVSVIFRIHPQARLRLERLMVASLQAAGTAPADRSIRPLPALFLIRDPANTYNTPWSVAAGAREMPPGRVTIYDEHGLIIDPFAFAAALDAIREANPAAFSATPLTGQRLADIAALAPPGRFIHAIDLHGRPWQAVAAGFGNIGLYTGAPASPRLVLTVNNGALYAWSDPSAAPGGAPDPALRLAAELNVMGAISPLTRPELTRFGFHPTGRMTSAPLAWPPAGPRVPRRDTLRVAVCDPAFHLIGNLGAGPRDLVPPADTISRAAQPPQIREGSPITLMANGRSLLGWMGQVFSLLQGGTPGAAFTTGPIFAVSPVIGANWPFPLLPGAARAWPFQPLAQPVAGGDAAVMAALAPLRASIRASRAGDSRDVVLSIPALPPGLCLRFYPLRILSGTSPDEGPLLRREDGPGMITSGGPDQILLRDPFGLGPEGAWPQKPELRFDLAVTWLPVEAPGLPLVRLIGNMFFTLGPPVAPPPDPAPNLLGMLFWRGTASNPMTGTPSRGPFPLASALSDPTAFMRDIARALTTDANPREAPRLPTMSRNETLFALQTLPAPDGDLYRAILSGGWLNGETDSHAPRLANPGAAGMHEVHAPGLAARGQLGFDLWVAAAHRARPVVPTADIAAGFTSGPMANLGNNWLMLQANAISQPPAPPSPDQQSSYAAALLQTVPAFVETPELALIPEGDLGAAVDWVTNELGDWVSTPNDAGLHRQIGREMHSARYGRRDAQWALLRALRHARELVYIETPLLSFTSYAAGAPGDIQALADLTGVLGARMAEEPRLRVLILTPREIPFGPDYAPFALHFYKARNQIADQLGNVAGERVDGLNTTRPRFLIAHPIGMPGRPLVLRSMTAIVDDVWCLTGASSLSRRGMTFDGSNDVVLTDWDLDRGAGIGIRDHRKALMETHLGVSPNNGMAAPTGDQVRLHNPLSAFEAFADAMAQNNRSKLLPLWRGPDPDAPDAPITHPPDIADPDGRLGQTFVTALAGALGGGSAVV